MIAPAGGIDRPTKEFAAQILREAVVRVEGGIGAWFEDVMAKTGHKDEVAGLELESYNAAGAPYGHTSEGMHLWVQRRGIEARTEGRTLDARDTQRLDEMAHLEEAIRWARDAGVEI